MIRNAFDMTTLPPLPIPRNGHRVFGYVGCIGHWFDWSVVSRLARAFRGTAVHIVGPCFSKPSHGLPSNVTLFPACSLKRAVEHLQSFSVGLIPFKTMPLTAAVDPIKYYGYRGMSLPVLSTAFGEMAGRGTGDGAFLIDSDTGLPAVAAAALDARSDIASIETFRHDHTWERRFEHARAFDRVLAQQP